MEAKTAKSHKIEPEIAGSPPREIKLPARLRRATVVAAVAMSILSLGAIMMLWEAGKLIWLSRAGTTIRAHVTEIHTQPPASPGDPGFQDLIRYTFDEPLPPSGPAREVVVHIPVIGQGTFGSPGAPRRKPRVYKLGDTLTFRCAFWFGKRLLRPWNHGPAGQILFMSLTAAAIFTVSGFVMLRLRAAQRRVLHVLSRHAATIGTIINRRVTPEQPPGFYVEYRYQWNPEDDALHREERCSEAQWRQFAVDQRVTVLYDPDNPADAGLYAMLSLRA